MAQALGLRSLSRAWRAYEGALHKQPVLTQTFTSASLWCEGCWQCSSNHTVSHIQLELAAGRWVTT